MLTGTQWRCAHSTTARSNSAVLRVRRASFARTGLFVCLFVSVERTRGQRGDGAARARALARCVATCCTALTASQHVAPRSLCCNMWQHAALRREGRDSTARAREDNAARAHKQSPNGRTVSKAAASGKRAMSRRVANTPRCVATTPRCVANTVRCVANTPRCVANTVRCVATRRAALQHAALRCTHRRWRSAPTPRGQSCSARPPTSRRRPRA